MLIGCSNNKQIATLSKQGQKTKTKTKTKPNKTKKAGKNGIETKKDQSVIVLWRREFVRICQNMTEFLLIQLKWSEEAGQ